MKRIFQRLWEANFSFHPAPIPPVVSSEDKEYSVVSQSTAHENSLKVSQKEGPPKIPSMQPRDAILSLGHG